ncbi:uncharacterized protein [Watersipora subatra]|uniref:uncharacterized protein n=1 Tax=Watersipora subatra TaxID=2589382 RepID=UPI00355B9491
MALVRKAEQMEYKSSETASGGAAGGGAIRGRYMQQAVDVIRGLHEEVDEDALESLKIMCQELSLDADTISRLLQTRKLSGLLRILLEYNSNNLPQLFVFLERFVPKIIRDMKSEVRDKLHWLSEEALRENMQVLENIYGREDTIGRLISLLEFREDDSTKLINICGMPGIGKSFLVKHLRNRLLNTNTFYVDARGVTSIEDLEFEIVVQSNILNYVPEKKNLMGLFSGFLKGNNRDQFVLIIDDLSGMMDSGSRSFASIALLDFLNNFILEMDRSQVKMKLVVTSQGHLEMLSESEEQHILIPMKKKIAGFTKDVPLNPLQYDDAVKFLDPSMQDMSEHEKRHLVRQCDGHPLSLQLMGGLATTDFTPTTEVTHVSPTDLKERIQSRLPNLFEKAFEKLSEGHPENVKILCSVVLFDLGAPLKALHYMVMNGKGSFTNFSDRVKKEFGQSFWLRLHVFSRQQYTMLTLHHPLVGSFLKQKMTESQEFVELKVKLKERFISYHIGKLVDFGKGCIPEPPYKSDFISRICLKFLQDLPNFKRMFSYVSDFNDSSFLFSGFLETPTNVAFLFVSIWQFHGWLEEPLMKSLENFFFESEQSVELSALVQTLYGMILAVSKQWDKLGEFFGPHRVPANRKRLIATSPQLYYFCEAVHSFTSLVFYSQKSFQKQVGVDPLVEKRKSAAKSAQKYISRLSDDWKLVKSYFLIHILMETAEAVFLLNPLNSVTLEEVFRLCEQAKDKLTQGHILESKVYAKLACYKEAQGSSCVKDGVMESGKATAYGSFSEAASSYKTVSKLLKDRKMDTGLEAAKNYSQYAGLLRVWGYVIVSSEGSSEQTTSMFELAEKLGNKAVSIYENCSMHSAADLLTAYIYHGMTYRNLYKYHHHVRPGPWVQKWQYNYGSKALKFYGRAYELLKNSYHKCGLTADDWRIDKLQNQLQHFMRLQNFEEESVDKVKANLQEIWQRAQRGAHEPLELSGSDVYPSSSDDDSLGSGHMDYEVSESNPVGAAAGSVIKSARMPVDITGEQEAKKVKH